MQLFQDRQSLLLSAVLQNPLDNSAAIGMRGKYKHLENRAKARKDQYKDAISATLHYHCNNRALKENLQMQIVLFSVSIQKGY